MSNVSECGYESGAPEVSPINIAPAVNLSQQAALLSPQPVVAAVPLQNIHVWFKEVELPTEDEDGDTVCFVLNFNVSVFDEATGKSRATIVQKKIAMSKRRLLADAENAINKLSAVVVEQTAQKKSDAVRMRELAGIPHNKNHV